MPSSPRLRRFSRLPLIHNLPALVLVGLTCDSSSACAHSSELFFSIAVPMGVNASQVLPPLRGDRQALGATTSSPRPNASRSSSAPALFNSQARPAERRPRGMDGHSTTGGLGSWPPALATVPSPPGLFANTVVHHLIVTASSRRSHRCAERLGWPWKSLEVA